MAEEKETQDKEGEHEEAVRLKTLAEQKYNSSNLKSAIKYAKRAHRLNPNVDGLSGMLTAFKILRVSSERSPIAVAASTATPDSVAATSTTPLDWYKILQIEPFSHINTIKKQYKRLALLLHPDKNHFTGSEEAFKLVGEAFRVLSDKIRRKEYDMKLRIAMQSAATEAVAVGPVETFWTACSTCRLLHQFEKKYMGHNLMCPNCKKSFKAVEVLENGEESENVEIRDEEDKIQTRASARIRSRNVVGKRKMSSVGEVLERSKAKRIELSKTLDDGEDLVSGGGGLTKGLRSKRVEKLRNLKVNADLRNGVGGVIEGLRSRRVEVKSDGIEALEGSKTKGDEMMTLAEMQMLAKRKVNKEKMKLRLEEKEKSKDKEEKEKAKGREKKVMNKDKEEKEKNKDKVEKEKNKGKEEKENKDKVKVKEVREKRAVPKFVRSEFEKRRHSKSRNLETEKSKGSKTGDLEFTVVRDSDFYDFDKDRLERKFKKGQAWAIYDDDDKMPRHYGLIDEVVSLNPFEVRLSWLDLENDGDEGLICWGRIGLHISCGRFKITRITSVKSVSIFSHVVDCERAAREMYRIYPRKGSVWALYNENAMDAEGRSISVKDKRRYDICVFLTSYSEIHGLSLAYLEKVDGFKTVFRRKQIGCHAVRWLGKDDIRLFSHQIPGRKLSGDEASGLSKDCWELDPASLPPELLMG